MLNSCSVWSTRIREFTNDRSLIRAVSSYIWAVIGQSARRAIQWCNKWSLRETVNVDTRIKKAVWSLLLHQNLNCLCISEDAFLPSAQTNKHLELAILPDVSGCVVDGTHEAAEVPHSRLPVFIRCHLPLLRAFKVPLGLFCQFFLKKIHKRGKINNCVKKF